MAMDEINAQGGIVGKKVELAFGDDESKPEVGVSVYEKFMTRDNVDVVIGGIHSSVNLAMQEAAVKYDKLFITGSGSIELLADRVEKDPKRYWMYFKSAPGYARIKPSYVGFFRNLEKQGYFNPKEKTIFTLGEDTDWGRSLGKGFAEAMAPEGWKVIATEIVKVGQADYAAQTSKLRALKPAIFYTAQTSPAAAASLCKSFRESGASSFYLAIYVPTTPEFIKLAGKASETLVWASQPDWVKTYAKPFLEKYKERFKEDPGANAAIQYDAMMNFLAASKLAKSTDPRKLADAMVKIKNRGNMGTYQYSPVNHEAMSGDDFLPVWFRQIIGGKHVALSPEKFKEGSYVTQEWLK
jgi:branched-chain amino acid transport system substrate-binding protein